MCFISLSLCCTICVRHLAATIESRCSNSILSINACCSVKRTSQNLYFNSINTWQLKSKLSYECKFHSINFPSDLAVCSSTKKKNFEHLLSHFFLFDYTCNCNNETIWIKVLNLIHPYSINIIYACTVQSTYR